MPRKLLSALLLLVIAGCAAGRHPGSSSRGTDPKLVLDKTWQWVSTTTPAEKITVPDPGRYTIHFTADGNLQARFDCNRGGGRYTISNGRIAFGPMMSTRMACPPDSLDSAFMRDLQRAVSFFVEDGVLHLELPEDGGMMGFRPE